MLSNFLRHCRFFTTLLALLTLSFAVHLPAQADTKLTYKDKGAQGAERTTLIQIHGNKVRMEEANSGIYSLYDDEKKVLYTINTKTRQYIETSPEKVQERMKMMVAYQDKLKEQMKQQIAKLPPDQRQMAEARMKQAEAMRKQAPPAMTFEKTDKTSEVQGMKCTIAIMQINGQPSREICNADKGVIDQADFEKLLSMFEYMDSIAKESAKAQGVTPPEEGSASTHKNGLALSVRALPKGMVSEIAAIDASPLAANDFAVPAGYSAYEPAKTPPTLPQTSQKP